jgi:hypothetical protein
MLSVPKRVTHRFKRKARNREMLSNEVHYDEDSPEFDNPVLSRKHTVPMIAASGAPAQDGTPRNSKQIMP